MQNITEGIELPSCDGYFTSFKNPERGFTFIKNEAWLNELYWIMQEKDYVWILDAKAEMLRRYSDKYREFILEQMTETQKVEMFEFLEECCFEANWYKDYDDPYFGPGFTRQFVDSNFTF